MAAPKGERTRIKTEERKSIVFKKKKKKKKKKYQDIITKKQLHLKQLKGQFF